MSRKCAPADGNAPAAIAPQRQLETLMAIAEAVCLGGELQAVLGAALEAMVELMPIRAAWIFLVEPGSERLQLAAYRASGGVQATATLPVRGSGCAQVMQGQDTVLHEPGHVACDPLCAALAGQGQGCSISVPLVCEGQSLGVLNLALAAGAPQDLAELPFVLAIAQQLSTAVQRHNLVADLLKREADRTELLKRLLLVQEDERKRISRELHDETGQALTSVLIGLKWMENAESVGEIRDRLKVLKSMVNTALDDVHKLSGELRPTVIDDMGLVSAVRSFANTVQSQQKFAVSVQVDNVPEALPPTLGIAVYRVVQEALSNVAKYAHARHVTLTMRGKDGQLAVTIADDGQGFDPQELAQRARDKRLGLLGMQERMFAVGGTCTIDSAPGAGTRVTARAPLPQSITET